jgi:hypothetical protein
MSVEVQILSAIIEQGQQGVRKLYAAGCGKEDFFAYDEEFEWIEQRASNRLPINPRVVRRQFPDFEFLPPTEPFDELVKELKNEHAVAEINNILAEMAENLSVDNAVQLASDASDRLAEVSRLHSPRTNERLMDDVPGQIRHMEQGMRLAAKGVPTGIPTGISHLDHHWGGWVGGRMYVVLGRPGDAKSFLVAMGAWTAKKLGYRVGLFSPEMNAHEHRCRVYTLASADKQVQKDVGLPRSFRNRALMDRRGFNMKLYKRFLSYMDEMPTDIHFLTGIDRREKITVPYVADKIEELGLDVVFIDPIYKLRSVRRRTTSWEELGELSDAIQDVSEQYDVPVIVTNQSHRQGASGDAPHKDRSFASDVPVQNADHVLGVKHLSEEHLLICRCTKSRFGQDFRFEARFFPNTGVFKVIDPPTIDYMNGSDDPSEEELSGIVKRAHKAVEEAEA